METEMKKPNLDRHAEKRWGVQLPARFKDVVVVLAAEKGLTATEFVTRAIESYMKRYGKGK